MTSMLKELDAAASILAANAETDSGFKFDLRTQNIATSVRLLDDVEMADQFFSILDYPNTDLKVLVPRESIVGDNDEESGQAASIIVVQVNFPAQIPLNQYVLNSELISVSRGVGENRFFGDDAESHKFQVNFEHRNET